MTPDDRQKHADWLRELGVPTQFHDEIIDAPAKEMIAEPGAVKGFPPGAAVAVLALYGFFGLIIGWLFFVRHVDSRAALEAAKNGATLIHLNLGIGFLLLLFAMFFGLAWVGAAGARRYRVNGALVDAAKSLQLPPEGTTLEHKIALSITRLLCRAAVRRAKSKSTTDEFLLSVVGFSAWLCGYPAFLLMAAGICVTVLESNAFWIAGPAGIIEHRMFPPFSVRNYDLAEATTLETGCSYASRHDEKILHYVVYYGSGDVFRLDRARAIGVSKLEALERIDTMLAPKIQHIRWEWLSKDPVSPTCFNYWATEFGANGSQRLAKLLRLTTEEALDLGMR